MSDRLKLSDVAYQRFRERLFARDVRPGQFVSQRELADMVGVPLSPMREALQRLEAAGLVRIVPQRGVRVADASLKMIRDTFQLRMIIEREAAARFADCAAEHTIEELEEAHRAILARARNGPDETLLEEAQAVDWRLHDTLIAAVDNALVAEIHRANSDRIRLIRLDHGLLTRGSLTHVMAEHLAIIDACRRRDESAAIHAMELHISMAMRRAMGL